MNHTRKFACLILSAVMVFSLAAPVYAISDHTEKTEETQQQAVSTVEQMPGGAEGEKTEPVENEKNGAVQSESEQEMSDQPESEQEEPIQPESEQEEPIQPQAEQEETNQSEPEQNESAGAEKDRQEESGKNAEKPAIQAVLLMNEPAEKRCIVQYMTQSGISKGTEEVFIDADATEIPAELLQNVPAGFQVSGAVSVSGRFATAIVIPVRPDNQPLSRSVKILFQMGADPVGEESRETAYGTTSLEITQAPEGYALLSSPTVIAIDDGVSFVTVPVRSVLTGSRTVQIRYIYDGSRIARNEFREIPYGTETVTPGTIPTGYALAYENASYPIHDGMSVVDIPVVKTDALENKKLVTVNYRTTTGLDMGQEQIWVDKDAAEIPAEALKAFPQGCELLGTIQIDGRFATAQVKIPDKIISITVNYKTGTGMPVGREIVKLSEFDHVLELTDLNRIPEGYQVAGGQLPAVLENYAITLTVIPADADGNPVTRQVEIRYADNAVVVHTETRDAAYGTTSLKITQAPAGYALMENPTVIAIDDGVSSVTVPVRSVMTGSRQVEIRYLYQETQLIGSESRSIAYGTETVIPGDLPLGYALAYEDAVYPLNDSMTAVNIPVVRDASFQNTVLITVNYKTSTGASKGQERIRVPGGTTEIPAEALKNIPQGYQVSGPVTVEGRFATAIVVPVGEDQQPLSREVTIRFVENAVAVDTETRNVPYGTTSLYIEKAPDGYELAPALKALAAAAGISLDIDDGISAVDVQVKKLDSSNPGDKPDGSNPGEKPDGGNPGEKPDGGKPAEKPADKKPETVNDNPRTGDGRNLILWFTLAVVSLAGAAVPVLRKRR